jgi:hypothetical protein
MAGLVGVAGANVLASSASVVVGGVWDESDMASGKGRVAVLMDIDWLNDSARGPIIENLANFLAADGLCSGADDRGLEWTSGPRACSTLTPGSYSWSARVDEGGGPYFEVVSSSNVTTSCSYTLTPPTATYTCAVSLAVAGDVTERPTLTVRALATDPGRQLVRSYKVRGKNDPRNVPAPFALDSVWWDWPDADGDGLPDKWETDGVWVNGVLLDLPALGARSQHKDLFVRYDYESGQAPSQDTLAYMRDMFDGAPLSNPDGDSGVTLHIDLGTSVPADVIGTDYADLTAAALQRVGTYTGFFRSPGYGGGGVPSIYKSLLNTAHLDGQGGTIGRARVKGQFGWTGWDLNALWAQLNVNLAGWDAVNMAKAESFAQASNAAHELGHMVGLRHHNDSDTPEQDRTYKSIMSYSYSNFGLMREGHSVIDYSRSTTPKLDWKMGAPLGSLTFVYGQDGELAGNFYDHQPDQEIPVFG